MPLLKRKSKPSRIAVRKVRDRAGFENATSGRKNISQFSGIHVEPTGPKRYVATFDARFNSDHELSHVRQIVFKHEHGRKTEESYLDQMEENNFLSDWPRLPFTDPTNLFNRVTRKIASRRKVSFDELIQSLKNPYQFSRKMVIENEIRYALASNFPSRYALMRAVIKLYRDPKMKATLDALEHDRWPYIRGTEKPKHLLKILYFFKKEARAAQRRNKPAVKRK